MRTMSCDLRSAPVEYPALARCSPREFAAADLDALLVDEALCLHFPDGCFPLISLLLKVKLRSDLNYCSGLIVHS